MWTLCVHTVTLGLTINFYYWAFVKRATMTTGHKPAMVTNVIWACYKAVAWILIRETLASLGVVTYWFSRSRPDLQQSLIICFLSLVSRLENLLPKIPPSKESGGGGSPDQANSSQCVPASRNGVTETSTTAFSTKERGSLPIMVPMIPPPLIKPPAGREHVNTWWLSRKISLDFYCVCQ